MELLQLRYFQKVAKMESMTKAAEELHIAQPSLSKTILRLEEQIGVRLFERNGKRIRLNESGKCFLARVDKALNELEDGIQEIRDLADKREERVSVGSATAKLLPKMIKEYLVEKPETKLRFLQVTQHAELLNKLEQGEIDICISSLPMKKKEICCEPLATERIYLVAPVNHPLACKKEISLHDIGKEPLISYTAECGMREIINQFCAQIAFEPQISCECTTSEVTCGLVEAGLGLAFLPEYLSSMEYTKHLVWIPVTEPDMKRVVWISWCENRYLSKAARDFREALFQYFS